MDYQVVYDPTDQLFMRLGHPQNRSGLSRRKVASHITGNPWQPIFIPSCGGARCVARHIAR